MTTTRAETLKKTESASATSSAERPQDETSGLSTAEAPPLDPNEQHPPGASVDAYRAEPVPLTIQPGLGPSGIEEVGELPPLFGPNDPHPGLSTDEHRAVKASEQVARALANDAIMRYEQLNPRPPEQWNSWGWTESVQIPNPSAPGPTPLWHLAPQITSTLQLYRNLQLEEKRLVELIYRLARQVALYGPLVAPAQRQIELEEEQAKLDRLRAEITQLEQQLDREVRDYAVAKAALELEQELEIRRQRIELLKLEIAHKQELAQIYEKNIRLLEQKRAHYGPDTPINVLNEIDETTSALEHVRAECRVLEVMIERQYAIMPEQLRGISLLSGRTMAIFVEEMVANMPNRSSEGQFTMPT